jgi:predicted GIY-YIG superfamily endonuclease
MTTNLVTRLSKHKSDSTNKRVKARMQQSVPYDVITIENLTLLQAVELEASLVANDKNCLNIHKGGFATGQEMTIQQHMQNISKAIDAELSLKEFHDAYQTTYEYVKVNMYDVYKSFKNVNFQHPETKRSFKRKKYSANQIMEMMIKFKNYCELNDIKPLYKTFVECLGDYLPISNKSLYQKMNEKRAEFMGCREYAIANFGWFKCKNKSVEII